MKRIGYILLLALIMLMAVPLTVLAIADPDSPPNINAVFVYDDLLEDGDAGVLIDYYLDQPGPPTETATESYMGIFIDVDGVTQLKSVAPYAEDTKGYGRGVIWIYFTAAEVTTHGIDRADIALYEVWLVGNPTLTWVPGPAPPKTTAGIDYWQPLATSTPTLMALRVLQYAQIIGLAWGDILLQETPLGHRLTAAGESYFTNAIPNLRRIAPSVFTSGETDPTLPELDYSTTFGATIANNTGTLTAASPLTLVEGANNVDVAALGTFTLVLLKGTIGTAESDVCQVTGTPVDLVYGTNTITTTAPIGNIIVEVELEDTQSAMEDTIIGTGLDLTEVASRFGMSRWMFSGLVWLVMTICVCAAVYKVNDRGQGMVGSGKVVLLVFDICIIGGAVLGLMHPLVAVMVFIGFGTLTGYVIFFRQAHM